MDRKYGRGPAKFRKIRRIAKYNYLGNDYYTEGLTVPPLIADQFREVFFMIRCTDTQIILESGCKNG